MKVLYVDQTGQLGGGEIALLPYLERHAENARMVLLEDGPFRELLERAGVPVEVLSIKGVKAVRRESGLGTILATIPNFLSLRRRFRSVAAGYQVIYANSQKAFILAALSKRRNQVLVWHLRDILTADHFSGILRRIVTQLGNRFATVVIANSGATAAAFVAAGGKQQKITVVHDGVSPHAFDMVEPDSVCGVRERLGVNGNPLVGIFGRLSEWKGQHVLLEAIASVPSVHVALVGDALFGEHAYAERLRQRAQEPDLEGRVHFLGFQSEIPRLMKAMDVVVHCSIAPEPFGLVIVEGMLARRPVIASRAGGALEIVTDGESGRLVTPGDATELREVVCDLLGDPEKAESLARNGHHRASRLFSVNALCEGITGALHTAVKELG